MHYGNTLHSHFPFLIYSTAPSSKMMTALPVLFLILSTFSRAEIQELQLYKACLMECFNCVQTYGKTIYNGKLCAENCAISQGRSIDTNCYPPQKRGGNQPSIAQACAKSCHAECSSKLTHFVDSYSCIFTCILSNKKLINC